MSRIFIPLFFAFVFVSLQTAAQESARIKVELIPGGDGSYELVCTPDSRVIGSFSVRVVFDNLVNIKSSNVIVGVTTPGSVIRTLRPEDPAKKYGFGFWRYWSIRGKYNARPDREFVYRVPVAAGRNPVVRELYNVDEHYLNQEKEEGWRPLMFVLSKGDTIFAARRGTVVEAYDGYEIPYLTDEHVDYVSRENYLLIEHTDGTLARYSVLQKGSLMVKPGDTVYPDTPLALAGTYNGKFYQLRFQLHTIAPADAESEVRDVKDVFRTVYLDPLFLTTEGIVKLASERHCTPVVNDDLIHKEMSKREAAKRK